MNVSISGGWYKVPNMWQMRNTGHYDPADSLLFMEKERKKNKAVISGACLMSESV